MSSIFLTKKLHFLNGENIQNKNGIDNSLSHLLPPIFAFGVRRIVKGKQLNDETTKVIPFHFDGGEQHE